MKTSIAIATFLVVGTGAASVGAALPSPWKGSDTLFDLTTQVIPLSGATGTYAGGGSGGGETAMAAATPVQNTAPMSRMLASGACGGNGGSLGGATGLVLGLDGVSVWGSLEGAGSATGCNNPSGGGLKHDATATGWKAVLKLVYFGEADPAQGNVQVCNGPQRTALVANWSSLFNNSCAGTASCPVDPTSGVIELLHAYRRDEFSGTSDVFASVVGGSPNVSSSGLNKYGVSPYCNALNWDNSTGNANCALGVNKQYLGPGGITDPTAADFTHRRPPVGAWGDTPSTVQPYAAPTSYQDNDPIRRTCVGTGNGAATRAGEQVCNTDGKLGLVLPIPAVDFIANAPNSSNPYPAGTAGCDGRAVAGFCTGSFILSAPPQVFTCANRGTGTFRAAFCANNDTNFGGQCFVPTNAAGSAVCEALKATAPATLVTAPNGVDGRAYNLHMRDGTATAAFFSNITSGSTATPIPLPFTGNYGRIHMTQTVPTALGATAGCEMLDATDQIGCLAHADQCSVGFAGLGAGNWNTRAACAPASADIDNELINGIAATVATVQAFGTTGAYPLSRKLYFNTIVGFNAAAVTADELDVAKYEGTNATFISNTGGTIPGGALVTNGFFTLGTQSPAGADKPFCEDFNEAAICAKASNTNGCPNNAAVTLPTASTTCGNGIREAYEECDCSDGIAADGSPSTDPQCVGANGAKNGAAPNICSLTCRLN
jgi:hypothetical protein